VDPCDWIHCCCFPDYFKMRFLIPLLFVAVTLVDAMPRGPPQQGGMPPIDPQANPGMRKAILDMIMSQIQRASPNTLQTMLGQLIGKYNSRPNHHHRPQGGNFGGFRPHKPGPPAFRPPVPPFQPQPLPNFGMPPGNVSRPAKPQPRPQPKPQPKPQPAKKKVMPPQPRPVHRRPPPTRPPPPANTGPLGVETPGATYGAATGGYASSMAFGGTYCPPGAASFAMGSDTCKDKIIYEALYNKTNGKPLYSWVPPAQPWDPYSIPDNVKDQAMNILIQKVMSSPTKKATNKQKDLMRALGDPPNHVKPMFGIWF